MFKFDTSLKTDRVLNAALMCFKQYGFKRTSMEDIAKAAEMSRPALYLAFKNKTDIFRSLATRFHEATMSESIKILESNVNIQTRLTQALITRKLPLFALANDSAHGPELLDVTLSVAAEINTQANTEFLEAFERSIHAALRDGSIQSETLNATELAQILYAGAYGLKETAQNAQHYETLIRKMVQTVFDGIAPK